MAKSNKKDRKNKKTWPRELANKLKSPKILLALWYLAAWSWTFQTDSLELAGSKPQAVAIGIIVVAINVAISATIMLYTAKTVGKVFQSKNTGLSLLAGWGLFALADFLVAWTTTIIWIGPEGLIDSILPLSSPALVLINTPLGFASRFIGFFGLAGLFWLSAYLLWHKNTRKLALIPMAILITTSFVGWAAWKETSGQTVKTTIISEQLDDRVDQIKPGSSDLVIFPEYGLDNDDAIEDAPRFTKDTSEKNTFYLGSRQVMVPGNTSGHYNTLIYGNTKDGETARQAKYRPIPGGEDLPYTVRLGLRATGQKATLDYFTYAKSVLRGDKQLEPFKIDQELVVGAGVCSSIISPHDYRTFTNNGATLLTNSASLTTFKGSRLFAWQQRSLAKFMAVSNSRYFLQSANAAPAYAYDNNGNLIDLTAKKATLDIQAQTNSSKTFYSKYGEVILLLGGFTLALLVASKIYRRAKKRTA